MLRVRTDRIEQSPTHTNDHRIAGAQVLGAAIVNRPHAFRYRLILQVDSMDTRVAVGSGIASLQLAIELIIIAGVRHQSKTPIPVGCIRQQSGLRVSSRTDPPTASR